MTHDVRIWKRIATAVVRLSTMALFACGAPESAMDSPSGPGPTLDRGDTVGPIETRLLPGARAITVCQADCDYTEIQPAVDVARNGDVVRVSRGTYAGPVVIAQKSIAIRGEGPWNTIIAGGYQVIELRCNPSVEVILSGVTITSGGAGRGVSNDGCALTLRDAAVTHNTVHGHGAGIWNAGTLVLVDCRLADNLARVAGGGLYNAELATARMRDTMIIGNVAGIGGGGGILNEGSLVVRDSVLSENTAKFGGGLFNAGAATISDSRVVANSAMLTGGGIENTASLRLNGSNVARNEAGVSGGGLSNREGGTVTFRDTSVRANTPDNCAGVACP